MKKKIMLDLGEGKEIDLLEVVHEANVENMKEMGFNFDESGRVKLASLPAEVKTAAMERLENAEISANFIKGQVVQTDELRKKYGVKAVESTEAGSMGATVPTTLAAAILEKKLKINILASRAFSFTLAGPYALPVQGDAPIGYWVDELDDGDDEDLVTESSATTDKKELGDNFLAARVTFSWKLLKTSAFNIEQFVANLAGRKLASTEETAFVSGTGTGQPKGLRTESGIPTIHQIGAGLAYDDVVALYHKLPAQYRQNAVWLASNKAAKLLHGLKDSQNRPLFVPGQPLDQLFNKPLLETVDIPENLGGHTDTEIFFGDPYYYWIKYGSSMEMASQIDVERLKTKLVVYQPVDGACVLAEAFAKLDEVKATTDS